MESTYRYILAFGSNLGDRPSHFRKALFFLAPYISIVRQTQWTETVPLAHCVYDVSNHETYLNFVCEVLSSWNPESLYEKVIVPIEDEIGHSRKRKWLPRELDIDILFAAQNTATQFEDCQPIALKTQTLVIPHQDYLDRSFWRDMVEKELGLLTIQIYSKMSASYHASRS